MTRKNETPAGAGRERVERDYTHIISKCLGALALLMKGDRLSEERCRRLFGVGVHQVAYDLRRAGWDLRTEGDGYNLLGRRLRWSLEGGC